MGGAIWPAEVMLISSRQPETNSSSASSTANEAPTRSDYHEIGRRSAFMLDGWRDLAGRGHADQQPAAGNEQLFGEQHRERGADQIGLPRNRAAVRLYARWVARSGRPRSC